MLIEHTLPDTTSVASQKHDRSPSPIEDVEEYPSYRQTLSTVRTLLDLTSSEEFSEQLPGFLVQS